MSRLLFTLPMTLMALSADAEPLPSECAARAAHVVAQLERAEGRPLTLQESRLAHDAALASCQGELQPGAAAPAGGAAAPLPAPTGALASAKPASEASETSRFDRFVDGLFSMDTQTAKTRPGGKYRYLEQD